MTTAKSVSIAEPTLKANERVLAPLPKVSATFSSLPCTGLCIKKREESRMGLDAHRRQSRRLVERNQYFHV